MLLADAILPDPRPFLERLGAGHLATQLGDDQLMARIRERFGRPGTGNE